jgi:hypothetical protein
MKTIITGEIVFTTSKKAEIRSISTQLKRTKPCTLYQET